VDVKKRTPQIIVIAGPNGAGKSTFAPHLLRDAFDLLEYVNADTIAQGLSAFNPESVAFEAGRVMIERLHSLASQEKSFAFESTLATRSYAPWLTSLKQQGYRLHLVYLWLRSPELALYRVQERVQLGGHDVPEGIVRRRYSRGIKNFFGFYQGLADSWVVFDNSESNGPMLVASGNGSTIADIVQQEEWSEIRRAGNAN
jgi:predicted ABC-type ATPase